MTELRQEGGRRRLGQKSSPGTGLRQAGYSAALPAEALQASEALTLRACSSLQPRLHSPQPSRNTHPPLVLEAALLRQPPSDPLLNAKCQLPLSVLLLAAPGLCPYSSRAWKNLQTPVCPSWHSRNLTRLRGGDRPSTQIQERQRTDLFNGPGVWARGGKLNCPEGLRWCQGTKRPDGNCDGWGRARCSALTTCSPAKRQPCNSSTKLSRETGDVNLHSKSPEF